ncbi:OmpA family protein [Daejeonella lutea]|uniref:WD40-like Beta Propeller Repeat n=1 Tax=Daejeonella lutea TaxID=572036 RepID=A0A1T5AMU9_9SPHI|nr:OmpA family protein [Daejeonella lutea]SKB35933.1 WD40-like Beta Propeller Repeat [Daejeonella lutea]
MRKILLLSLLFCSALCFGQKVTTSQNKLAQKSYLQANKYIGDKAYNMAITELKKAVSEDNKFTAAFQQLGDLYRRIEDYPNAVSNYRKVIEIDPEFHNLTYFGLGESELNTGDYANALLHFRKYASFPGLSDESKIRTAKYIADCVFSLEAIKKPVSFKPVNMGPGINSNQDEYLPVITADESKIIFTKKTSNNEDFFTSVKNQEKWSAAKALSANINTFEFNEGAQCISPDGNYLFFTGCNRPDGLGRCDIYVSKWEGNEWSRPFNLGAPINTPGWESQPSISADGRTLYFVSTRNGGRGGYDLWKSDLMAEGSWSVPVNLGPEINTAYDEQSPFIHPDDQTLYFSSNGWPGLGSKDLFITRKKNPGEQKIIWEKPQNLGYPINTFGEESGLSISSSGCLAFFASDKQGGSGGFDIYSFEMPENLRPKSVTYVKGLVFDKNNKQALEAKVQIINLKTSSFTFDDFTDGVAGEFLATMTPGNSFALNVSKPGYMFYSQNFTPDLKGAVKPYLIEVPLQKVEVGGMVVLNNIFFETNKFELLPESKTELGHLITFLRENPTVTIEIAGHTDNVGDDKSNQLLSENRAKTVYDYLIFNKVKAPTLSFKGYGESAPVMDNSTEENRKNNRRTEFKILKK